MTDVPDDLEHFPSVAELGGAIGRRATVHCQQAAHDLCDQDWCMCRCHKRHWYDRDLNQQPNQGEP